MQGFLQPGVLEPGVLATALGVLQPGVLTTRGSYDQRFLKAGVLYSTANDPQPQMIPRPQKILKMNRK